MLPDERRAEAPSVSHDRYDRPDTEAHQGKGTKLIVWIVLLLVFAAGFVLILRHKDTPAAKPAGRRGAAGGNVATTAAKATQGDIGVYIDAIGTVTPTYTANIVAQVSGIVTAVHYREGQMVGKGTPLVEIDPRPYQATLMQAQGTLEHDQNILAQAQMDLDRYRAAWARNAIPKQQLDDQEKIVLQDQGTVKYDQGTVAYDSVQLGYCHIVAPVAGRVGLRLVDPGNVVTANSTTPLAVVTTVAPITVVFSVPEDSLPQIAPRLKQHARLEADAFGRADMKQIATGTLITLDNQIDTTTGTVKARAEFSNQGEVLYPNQFVNIRLLVQTDHDATLIPTQAIQHDGTVAFVYVLADGVAHRRQIQAGTADAGKTAVTGIDPGDIVATSSFDKLQDGAKVTVSKGAPGGGAPPNPADSEAGSPSGSTAP